MPSNGILCRANLFERFYGTGQRQTKLPSTSARLFYGFSWLEECKWFYNIVYVHVCKICEEKSGGCWWSFSWLGQSNPVAWHPRCVCDCPNESTGPLFQFWSIQRVTKRQLIDAVFHCTVSAATEAEKGLYLRRYPYRRYNKLGPVSFWPYESLVSEKRWCSCSKLVQHTELTLCVQQNMKKIRFHLLAYFMKLAQLNFRIGSYINVFHWNGHVAIYFKQFYADKGVKGPKIYPKYGDVWWFWPN